jgi:RNA polymerase sigma factor (sigma-70 family)
MATTTVDINSQSEASTPDRDRFEEFTDVVTRCLPVFYRIALRRLGIIADAEDAVQDAFLSAYRNLDQFKGEAKFSTWLTSIVINSAGSKLRRHPGRMHISLDGEDQTSNYHPLSFSLSDHTDQIRKKSTGGWKSPTGCCDFQRVFRRVAEGL